MTTFSVVVEEEPRNKTSPAVFTVYVFGNINHDGKNATGSRPLRGVERRVMGMYFVSYEEELILFVFEAQEVREKGALAVYESNLRRADINLLRDGNLTEVPPTPVLKTAGQEVHNEFRLDEDMFKEVRIFREIIQRWDETSEEIKGMYCVKGYRNMICYKKLI